MYPEDFRYSRDHEWVEVEGQNARVGVTEFAQEQLGDVVFIELPKVGDTFKQNDVFGTIESVKAVSELYCPVSGEVIAVNESLDNEPELVNEDAHGEGWMVIIKMSDPSDLDALLTAEEYEEHIEEEEAESDYDDEEEEDPYESDGFDDDFDGGSDDDY